MVPFCPVPFCPTVPFCPNMPCSILPQSLRLGKSHYVNYNIAPCSIKWCENTNRRYIIIFNYMQRFYYLICQSTWCQNASRLIYQKGEISFLWDTKNVVYRKFDFHAWRWIGRWQKSSGLENRPTLCMVFPKHPVFHFAPMFHFAPTYYTGKMSSLYWIRAQVVLKKYLTSLNTLRLRKKWLMSHRWLFKKCILLNEMYKFWLRFHWSLFLSFELTRFQHWFR